MCQQVKEFFFYDKSHVVFTVIMFLISYVCMFLCENYKTHTHTHTYFRIICTVRFVTVEDRVAFIEFNGDNVTGINI